MAFDLRFLGRVSSSANSKAPTTWSYTSATDTLETIRADGYFNNVMVNLTTGVGKFSIGNTILVAGSDNHQILSVSSVTGTVTTIEIFSRGSMLGQWVEREIDTVYIDEHDGIIVVWIDSEAHGEGTLGTINIETPTTNPRGRCQCNWQLQYDMYIFAASATSLYKGGNNWIARKGGEVGSPTYKVWYVPFSFGTI